MFFKFLTSKHGKFGIVSNKIVVIKKLKNSLKNTKYHQKYGCKLKNHGNND